MKMGQRDELFGLISRFVRIGCLLPAIEDLENLSEDEVVNTQMVLAEMAGVKVEIDTLSGGTREADAARRERRPA